jgi:hypothetical protein
MSSEEGKSGSLKKFLPSKCMGKQMRRLMKGSLVRRTSLSLIQSGLGGLSNKFIKIIGYLFSDMKPTLILCSKFILYIMSKYIMCSFFHKSKKYSYK